MPFDSASASQLARLDGTAGHHEDTGHFTGRWRMALGVSEGLSSTQPPADRPSGQGSWRRCQPAGVRGIDVCRESFEEIGVVPEQAGLAGEYRDQIAPRHVR